MRHFVNENVPLLVRRMLPRNVEDVLSIVRVHSEYNISPYPRLPKSARKIAVVHGDYHCGFGGYPAKRGGGGRKVIMPPRRSSPRMMHQAGELRCEPTLAEAKLWKYLRSQNLEGTHFRRQYAIDNYAVDFCAPRAKLIIEVDGSPHLDQKDYDSERTESLKAKGYRVLRFWNSDVLNNTQDVMTAIFQAIPHKQINQMPGEGK
jgi:very-short-patch-repair endonuclease